MLYNEIIKSKRMANIIKYWGIYMETIEKYKTRCIEELGLSVRSFNALKKWWNPYYI